MTDLRVMKYRNQFRSVLFSREKRAHTWIYSLISIALGFLMGLLIMLIVNPSNAGEGFSTLITGGIPNGLQSIGNVLFNTAPLIGVGLAVAVSSKAGIFNIGGSGQYTVGACASLIVANLINPYVPSVLGFIICLLVGMLAGALWALIPALLKNHFNVNIVVSAIMMNYIAVYTTSILAKNPLWFDSFHNRINNSKLTNCIIPQASLNKIFATISSHGSLMQSRLDISIIIAVIACLLLFFLFSKTTFGLRIRISGQNETASKYSGISNRNQIAYAMMISGAMAGMGGVFAYLSKYPTSFQPVSTVSNMGFTGISVALIANNNPIACIFSALLISYIQTSGAGLTSVGFNANIIGIITSTIIYSSATAFLLSSLFQKMKGSLINKFRLSRLTDGLKKDAPVFDGKKEEK